MLKGISYDPKSDMLEIQVEKMQRHIYHPKEIYVEELEEGWISGMQVNPKGKREKYY